MLTQTQYANMADKLCRMGFKADDLAPKKAPVLSWEHQKPSTAELADNIVEYLKRQTDFVTSKQIAMALNAAPMSVGLLCRAMPALESFTRQGIKLWKWGGSL